MSRTQRLVAFSAATATAVTVPLSLMFSVLLPHVQDFMRPLPTWASLGLGLTMFAIILAVPALLWSLVAAWLVDAERRPMVTTTLCTALPLAIVVGLTVDLSQLFIDTVRPWHDLGVHALFALAFAVGLSVFLGTFTARLRRGQARQGVASMAGPSPVAKVAAATTIGVFIGAAIALPLGWQVQGGMGTRMLAPLYLVLFTGTAAGGAALGAVLLPVRRDTTGDDGHRMERTRRHPAPH